METSNCIEAEIISTENVATETEYLNVEVLTTETEPLLVQRVEVEIGVNSWQLVSDAIYIKNITGEEPAWFTELIDSAIRDNEDLALVFDEIQTAIEALDDGYTNLVSITDNHASQISALKISSDASTAAIVNLQDVKITATQASAISDETLTAWMRGGESAAWFNSNVQAVATDTTANTLAIVQLSAEVDGIEAGVIEVSEALVDKYENPEWDGTTDPDPAGQPQWLYNARAKHSLNVNANGSISGFIADAVSGPYGSSSLFKIHADVFEVADSATDAGIVAFKIEYLESTPIITLQGNVYFGEYPGHELQEYTLMDMVVDNVLDPVEKNNVEQIWSDLVAQYDYVSLLLEGRYSEIRDNRPIEYAAFHTAYNELETYLAIFDIPRPDPAFVHIKSTIDRGEFEENFKEYNSAYSVIKEMIEDRVKQVADDAYNYIGEIVVDLNIDVEEKTKLLAELDRIQQEYDEYAVNVPVPDCVTYPDAGFAPYTKELLHYEAFKKYERSIYSTIGDPTGSVCTMSGPVTTINGLDVELRLYDLNNPIDTLINQTEYDAIMASSRWYVDSRSDLNTTILGTTVNTKFLRIADDDLVDTPYTLIIDDTIETGIIAEQSYYGSAAPDSSVWDLKTGEIRTIKKPIGTDPTMFKIDSTAAGVWTGICKDENSSNIRGQLVEGGIGSFGVLYSGDVVTLANKMYIIKKNAFRNVSEQVDVFEAVNTTVYSDSVRFFSPTNIIDDVPTNDYRIRKLSESYFIATVNGAYFDIIDEDKFKTIELTLEYKSDSGPWMIVDNQVASSPVNQTIMFNSPVCVDYVDFRMVIRTKSKGFGYEQKYVNLTIMLNN